MGKARVSEGTRSVGLGAQRKEQPRAAQVPLCSAEILHCTTSAFQFSFI